MELFSLILCLIAILLFLVGIVGCIGDLNAAKEWPCIVLKTAIYLFCFAAAILLTETIIVIFLT